MLNTKTWCGVRVSMTNWRWLLVVLYTLLLCLSLIVRSRTQEEDDNVNQILVEWDGAAVLRYTPDSPLVVNSGDKLIFRCPNGSFSNLWYQPARAQYNECDCNIGQPDCQRIGECTGPVKNFTQTINSNSGMLATVPVYEAGQMYYFTSFSDGNSLRDAVSERRGGGECETLRMAIRVMDATATTEPQPDSSPYPTFGPSSGNANAGTPGTPRTPVTPETSGTIGNVEGGGPGGTVPDIGTEGSGTASFNLGEVAGVGGGSINSYSQFITCCSVVLCTVIAMLQRY